MCLYLDQQYRRRLKLLLGAYESASFFILLFLYLSLFQVSDCIMSIRDRLLDCTDKYFKNNNIYILAFLNRTVNLHILNKILISFPGFLPLLNQVTEYLIIYLFIVYYSCSQNELDIDHICSCMQSMPQRH